jgi:2-polyprenyl-6-methoxyphenol hydroxylase-like FAD-dependent oxidoreductase
MAPLKVLICGGGCAGPALAYWLARTGHEVAVVERYASLRASGAQIDFRAQGIEVIKRMGLLDIIRSKLVGEAGTSFIDSNGNVRATIFANKSGKGAQSLTSEYEIMRRDFVQILYDATKDNVKYIFGTSVDRFEQDEHHVVAYFSDGTSDTFDILVGADGQGSRIRKAILPPDSPDVYRRIGIHTAYWFIPRIETDNNFSRFYHSPRGRMSVTRSHNSTETQIYFLMKDDSEDMSLLSKATVEQQKQIWADKFRDAGWQTERFLKGMETAENFYCHEVVQVKTKTWYKGRVVLLGDAAHCPSPMTGQGTTGCLVGAYVLAGEINRSSDDLSKAFEQYDTTLRPFVDEIQKIVPFFMRRSLPDTQWGIAILHFIVGLICWLRIPEFISRFSPDDTGGWKLPDYPELNGEA